MTRAMQEGIFNIVNKMAITATEKNNGIFFPRGSGNQPGNSGQGVSVHPDLLF
jgi:hypothetical protein